MGYSRVQRYQNTILENSVFSRFHVLLVFLQSKHVLRERLLTGWGLQAGECAQVPEKCHLLSLAIRMPVGASAHSMKDGIIPYERLKNTRGGPI
jgi:hypothetical protein